MFLESSTCPTGVYSRGVHCFGDNTFGQIGTGGTSGTPASVISKVVGLPENIRSLSSGGDHSCIVDGRGRVFCWGRNVNGESGGPTTSPVTTPIQVSMEGGSEARAVSVACGSDFSCAVMVTGEVQCWGNNESGQLGRVPAWMGGPTPPTVLAPGWNTPFNPTALRVLCGSCGNTPYVRLATQVSAGTAAACARLSNGVIRCWGRNPRANGGTARSAANEDTRIFGCGGDPRFCGCGFGAMNFCGAGAPAVTNDQIALNVLPHAGRFNANFETHLTMGFYLPPGCADGSSLAPYVSVSVHNDGGCVLDAQGVARCWGDGANGRRGDGATSGLTQLPQEVLVGLNSPLRATVALNGGDESTCVLRSNGQVFCWGANALGQSGVSGGADQNYASAVKVEAFNGTVLKSGITVTAGREQSCMMNEGWVRCWGARTGNTTFPANYLATPITAL